MSEGHRWYGEDSNDLLNCPRKLAECSPVFYTYHLDVSWREDNTCSWCGSLKPAEFFAALDRGAEYVGTDKSYKAYLSGEEAPGVRGACKFYFQHMDESDMGRFIDLMNAGTIQPYVLPYFVRRGAPEPSSAA